MSKNKYYFRFQRNADESFVETIFFETESEAAIWREQLASAPVFFEDFYSRYKILDHISKEGKNKMVQIQLKGTGDPLLGRYRTLSNFHDKGDLESVKNEFLREAMILFRLNPMNITAKLHEMHYANHSFFLVEDPIHGVPFADWFVDTWGFEHANIRELSSVYRLLGDLTQLVLTMTDFDVSHRNLNKYTILVNTYMMKSPQTASRLLQQKKTVKGFSSLYFKALKKNSKNQTGHLTNQTEEDETLISKRASPLVQKHKFFLTAFGEAVDTMINLVGHKQNQPTGSPRKQGRYTTFAKRHAATSEDVLKLGFIFCEVLYGIDIPKALQQNYGLDSQFASEVVSRPQFALFSRDPLYDVDHSLVEVLAAMLDPDPTKRPTIREVFDVVQICIREYRNPERARSSKPKDPQGAGESFISRLSFEPQTPLSAFHKRKLFQDKPGDSGSTQIQTIALVWGNSI